LHFTFASTIRSPSLDLSFPLALQILSASLTRNNFDLIFTYPSWALRHSPPKVLLASTSLKGEEDLSWPKPVYLHWVSTLEERPAEHEVVSSSACLNTWDKVALWCPRPRRACYNSTVSSSGFLNTKATSPYLCALGPTSEERPARRQHRFVLVVSKNTKAISVLGTHARGEAR